MNNIKLLFLSILLTLFLFSCKDKMDPKYERPDWLAGKVYTVILEHQDTLSTFANCIKLTGYDKILDVSGSYTVFAPSNEAFDSYFAANPKYNSIEDIPLAELERLVKFHLVQNPWSKEQLRSLDNFGWIDTTASSNNTPEAFKRQTLLLEKNIKYGVSTTGYQQSEKEIIVDTLKSNLHRIVSTDSRKYAPIFFSEYLSLNELNSNDYEFYFDRPFDGGKNLYFAGAKVISDEIIAENGFVYIVDKVTEPLKNASQILSNKEGSNQYTSFLNLLYYFPQFRFNQEKTNLQTGADIGMEVDSLFDLSFNLLFDFNNEKTSSSGRDGTVRYHRGMMAPTNQAFQQFINDYLKIEDGWGSLENIETPDIIRQIIAESYMSSDAIYPSDFENGFYNGLRDFITLNESNIVQKEFGSNSTFIGLNEVIVPRAFSSVAGPIFLKQGYKKVMYAIFSSGLLNALNRPNEDYMFFVEPDVLTSQDSSLIQLSPHSSAFAAFELSEEGDATFYFLSTLDLRTLLMNHIAKGQPDRQARKEFIPNLAGNFIIVNNETGEVSGTGNTTIGFRGAELAPEYPEVLEEKDNGTTYKIKNWFTFNNVTLYQKLSSNYPRFHALLKKAGFANDTYQTYSFVSNNEFYTVFVPNDAALSDAAVDDMPIEELKSFLQFHFIQGDMIFTDGKKAPQYYETARIDERSTKFTTIFTKLYINPSVNAISFPDKTGANYAEVFENGDSTNIITGVYISSGTEISSSAFPTAYSNGVVHEIDKVLKFEKLDTN